VALTQSPAPGAGTAGRRWPEQIRPSDRYVDLLTVERARLWPSDHETSH
jgi:hypothetical protein